MDLADRLTDRQARCERQLLRLRMLTLSEDSSAVSRQATEIRVATKAVIAEVEAMNRAVLKARRHEPGAETFLWVRITRLAMAADDAVNAARGKDRAAVAAHLRHFHTLTSAFWTVQGEVYGEKMRLSLPYPASGTYLW